MEQIKVVGVDPPEEEINPEEVRMTKREWLGSITTSECSCHTMGTVNINKTSPFGYHEMDVPTRGNAMQAVRTLLRFIGEDADRPGLVDTPERVVKAWEQDWGIGYNKEWVEQQKASILKAQFTDGADGYSTMVIVRRIPFTSFCEHHLALFSGFVDIAYIPQEHGKILGLSKLVRVVNLVTRRLQVQERITVEIADFLEDHINPIGVGVIVTASHSCMSSRGVRTHGTDAVTSALRGEMLEKPEVRAEFLKLVRV